MKNKKILVTSGGTQEYIDDFRILTNISSGMLGYLTAMQLAVIGAQVFYVCSKSSIQPTCADRPMDVRVIRTVNEAMEEMKKVIIENEIDAVVHAMAVSDFTFKKDKDIKCKSSDPMAFIEYMRQTIAVNPKIISMVKQWRPETILIGFKFEIGLTLDELTALALTSIKKNGCDLVIANDKREMKEKGRHIGHFVHSEKMKNQFGCKDLEAYDKDDIAFNICSFLRKVLNE
jgi:phosphopantothenate--cysteine ligase